ncbi:uncharacterized protein LOC143014930 [Genypterus blacodes]|uniref:uncharacterized protein LOC143014930 n=1 Tax=Genypterus blacodes TaxID=154954 RepID=UPI003F759878
MEQPVGEESGEEKVVEETGTEGLNCTAPVTGQRGKRGKLTQPREKVKVENKPDSDVDSGQPGPQSSASSAEESSSNIAMVVPDTPGEDQSTGKRVVRVVRRVVRRVVPAGVDEQNRLTNPESAKAAASADTVLKPTKTVGVEKDDISVGLTSLMGRGRTKDHRPRTRTQDRKEDSKEDVKQEEDKGKVEEGEAKAAVEKAEEAVSTSVSSTTASNPVPPKSNPLTPPVGFIPVPKPDPLAPPIGFIPAPKPDPLAPPAGFIPAPRQNPLSPPPGFIPASKQNPLPRPAGFIPRTDPLAPPVGFIPKPRIIGVKKPEVQSDRSACLPNLRVEHAE